MAVTASNAVRGSVYLVSLARMENDPVRQGGMLADYVLAFLTDDSMRLGKIGPRFIDGESFP